MINEVLHRGFVHDQLDAVEAKLGEKLAIRDAGEEGAYISRDSTISLLQTVLEEELRAVAGIKRSDARTPATHEMTDLGERFSKTDPRWVTAIAAALARRTARGRHPLPPDPADVEIARDARLVLVGDWGTATDSARRVGGQMRAQLRDADDLECHAIHLGDVYYSGEAWECEERFLDPWPVRAGEEDKWRSWSLNGNHDMYCGGWGYFDTVLADPRFERQSGSSWFRLHNDHWQLLALDTAWEDHLVEDPHSGHIDPAQAAWVEEHVRNAGGRRTILLSHHQPFSIEDHPSSELRDALAPVLVAGTGVDAWFWGHEHRCIAYAEHAGVARGRCIGHGGVPAKPASPCGNPLVEWELCESWEGDGSDRWAVCGFAVLDLAGSDATVRYIDEDGAEGWSERW